MVASLLSLSMQLFPSASPWGIVTVLGDNKLAIIFIASVFNVKCVKLQQTNSKQQNILWCLKLD